MNTVRYINDSALTDNHAVIESGRLVSTGNITYLEGEMLEVELASSNMFAIGALAKIVIYSADGLIRFDTYIVAKTKQRLMILVPEHIRNCFMSKRRYPRLDAENVNGFVLAIKKSAFQEVDRLEEPIEFALKNISLGGIGVECGYSLQKGNLLDVSLNLEFELSCQVEIMHCSEHYGAKFNGLSERDQMALRAFIIKLQAVARNKAEMEAMFAE